ncbi:hypothetical protein GCM10017790_00450 [Amycolatopsis oliviviridis]|uniref:Uncharacterized protein n=1 Tax=Amycolatopsis oliviviridis TaxID=1471590 RepID=A0ABQ3L2Q1_9PSEU|nr:hypothetical protein GCM10017790_00450 [Amycolatopsis oliviviridis]
MFDSGGERGPAQFSAAGESEPGEIQHPVLAETPHGQGGHFLEVEVWMVQAGQGEFDEQLFIRHFITSALVERKAYVEVPASNCRQR